MAYIGTSPSNGVRRRFVYEATASQTSFSGSDENGVTLTYVDSLYLDVFQNGIKLKAGDDYTATTGTTVVLVQGASANDVVEMVAFDVFSVGDTVSAKDGGNFAGNVAMAGTLSVTGGIVSPVTINGTTPTLTIGDAGAEDAKIVFDGNAQDFHIGLDDSTDSLTIGLGSALGTTSHMVIDATGAVTMPLQPAFLAKPSSQQANIGEGSEIDIVFGTERFDQNGDFASSVFTAPVTGKYFLSYSLWISNIDNAFTAPVTGKYQISYNLRMSHLQTDANYYFIKLVTSNRTIISAYDPIAFDVTDLPYWTFTLSLLVDMDANDTCQLKVNQQGGGSAVSDIIAQDTYLSGYLVA